MTDSVSRPVFLATDPLTVTTDCIALFESTLGKTLEPAQVERLLVNAMAYRESLLRMDVQRTGEQCLVAFATGTNLERLADLVGVTRLVNVKATVTVRFTLSTVQGTDVAIAAGTRVKTYDEAWLFEVTTTSKIAAGNLYADIECEAQVAGSAQNRYTAGQIATLVDPIVGVASVANTTTSTGGVDTETDDALRERCRLAPYRFGTAGSYGAYRFWALSAGAWVVDAKVTSPTPGNIQVAVLTNQGEPTADQLQAVEDILTDETVRPITDTVTVIAANQIDYDIDVELTLYTGQDSTSVSAAVTTALEALAQTRRVRLGLDITPAQILAAVLTVPGIYDATLNDPTGPVVADDGDWLNLDDLTVTVTGTANG
jgi:phage-related baseplate assembly protein